MARSSVAGAEKREFIAITDWDWLQNPKRPEYPAWTRLHREWLQSYEFMQLSMADRGFLLCMHMLAAQCANRIPNDPSWIARSIGWRPQLVSHSLSACIALGLLSLFVDDAEGKKNKHLRKISGTQRVPVEGEGEGDRDISGKGGSAKSDSKPADHAAPAPPQEKNNFHPAPAPGRFDPRSFDDIKDLVYELATKLNTTNPESIFRLGGVSRQLSKRQIEVAVKQLIEDGKSRKASAGERARRATGGYIF